jgi:MFS family permease
MFRGLPRAFWILCGGALINRLGSFVVPFLAIYLTTVRQVGVEAAGFTVALHGMGSFVASPLGGVLADRIGRRRTMLVALLSGAAAMAHLGLARAPAHIAFAAFILGLAGDLYRPAVSAAIADVVPPADRARAYGLLYWAINVGFAVAVSVGGLLATRHFLLLFAGDALTTLIFAGIVWSCVPETRPPGPPHAGEASVLPDARFVVFLLVTLAISCVLQQAAVALPIDMLARGVSARAYGMLMAFNGVLVVLLQPPLSRWTASWRRRPALALSSLLVGTGFALNSLARGAAGYAVAICTWTLGEIVMSGVGPAAVAGLSPTGRRGAYQGFYQMAWSGSAFVAPIVGSIALARLGSGPLWTACLLVGAGCALGQMAMPFLEEARGARSEEGGQDGR